MNVKLVLLSGAALVALAGPALAQDAAPKSSAHHRHRALHHAVNAMDARIDALEAQIHELKAEEQRQAQHTAEVQAQVAAAPAEQPQVPAAQFEALQNQVYEQAAAAKTSGTGWWDNTKVGGLVFFDLTDIDNKNGTTANSQNGTHFDIKRFYLTIDHKFNDVWSAHLTTDATYDTSQCDGVSAGPPASCSSTGSSTTQLYIKKAYLEANFANFFDVR
ncbi:MAG TPA: hypothetical protein VGG36_06015, partial [Rhizomicrobium sp.]